MDATQLTARPLRASELEQWFDFLEAVFAFKPTPREFFVAHYTTDPHADTDGIWVLADDRVEGYPKFASTLRIFHRHFTGLTPDVLFGGLGEVGTDPAWRGKGLAGRLLSQAVSYMAATKHVLSLLHSSSVDAQRLYARSGYVHLPCTVARLTCRMRGMGLHDKGPVIEQIDFSSTRQVAEISALYEQDSKGRRWPGPCKRVTEYWTRWVRPQVEASSSSLSKYALRAVSGGCTAGYMFAAVRPAGSEPATLFVNECVTDPHHQREIFAALLAHVVQAEARQLDGQFVVQGMRAGFGPAGVVGSGSYACVEDVVGVEGVAEAEERGFMGMVVAPFEITDHTGRQVKIASNEDLLAFYNGQVGLEPVMWKVDGF